MHWHTSSLITLPRVALLVAAMVALLLAFSATSAEAHASCTLSTHTHNHNGHGDLWQFDYKDSFGYDHWDNVTHGTTDTAFCGCATQAGAAVDHRHAAGPC